MVRVRPQSHREKKVDYKQIIVALRQQMFLNFLQSPAVVLSGADT